MALLLACSAGALYAFLSCFKHIDGKAWGLFFRTTIKLLVCTVFGGLVVVAAQMISQLTN
jgi:hypothetical protein